MYCPHCVFNVLFKYVKYVSIQRKANLSSSGVIGRTFLMDTGTIGFLWFPVGHLWWLSNIVRNLDSILLSDTAIWESSSTPTALLAWRISLCWFCYPQSAAWVCHDIKDEKWPSDSEHIQISKGLSFPRKERWLWSFLSWTHLHFWQ